jgi:tetratricopeptide (TPR) repeat protein
MLLRDNPTSYLASRSARKLTDLLMADAAAQTIDLNESLSVLREVVRRRDDSAETARIQFAIAELIYGRSLAPDQAISEYQRALEMKPDAELRTLILERLEVAANERLVIRPVQPNGG